MPTSDEGHPTSGWSALNIVRGLQIGWRSNDLIHIAGRRPEWGLTLHNPTGRTVQWHGGVLAVKGVLRSQSTDQVVNTSARAAFAAPALDYQMDPGMRWNVEVALPLTNLDLEDLPVGRYELSVNPLFLRPVEVDSPEPLRLQIVQGPRPQH